MNQISLDINKSGQIINEPVVLRVGEKDQTITVNLLKDGQPYTSFTTATFFANKPSGSIVANDPANISNGVITYTVPQALVNEFGKITNAYFLIDGKTSTESFVIAVLQGVNISDDLSDYIPGMGQLNVVYDEWKAKLQTITDELTGIDAPKEVKNVIDNELKNYTDQINELQRRITDTEAQLNALEVPEIGGRNYIAPLYWKSLGNIGTYDPTTGKTGGNPKDLHSPLIIIPNNYKKIQITTYEVSADGAPSYVFFDKDKNFIPGNLFGVTVGTISVDIPNGAVYLGLAVGDPGARGGKYKVEFGNIPTDWTPAPEDMVTVSDINDWQKKYTAREDAQDNAIIVAQSTANGKFDTNQAESYLKSITALPETFANLAAIKAKYPSGKNGLMVAADNGHKYIWANSTWTDAGVYQSAGIADRSIDYSKIVPDTLSDTEINKINYSTVVDTYAMPKRAYKWQIGSKINNFHTNGTGVVYDAESGNQGIVIPVIFRNPLNSNSKVFINFDYRTSKGPDGSSSNKNQLDIWFVDKNGSLLKEITSFPISSSRNHIQLEIKPVDLASSVINGNEIYLLLSTHDELNVVLDNFMVNFSNLTGDLESQMIDIGTGNVKTKQSLVGTNNIDDNTLKGWNLAPGDKVQINNGEIIGTFDNTKNSGFIIYANNNIDTAKDIYIHIRGQIFDGNDNSVFLCVDENLERGKNVIIGKLTSYDSEINYRVTPSLAAELGVGVDGPLKIIVGGANSGMRVTELSISNDNVFGNLRDNSNYFANNLNNRHLQNIGGSVKYLETAKPVTIDGIKNVTPNYVYQRSNGVLKTINFFTKTAGNKTFRVGKIDQHNLIVDAKEFSIYVPSGYSSIDVENKNIEVNNSDQVFADLNGEPLYQADNNHLKYSRSLIQDNKHDSKDPQYKGPMMYETSYIIPFSYEVIDKNLNDSVNEIKGSIDSLSNSIQPIIDSQGTVSVTAPNGKKYRIVVDDNGNLSTTSFVPEKVAIFGNSLTKEYGGIGMAASDQYHDWYHYVTDYIKSQNPSASINPRTNVSGWESSTTSDQRQQVFEKEIKPVLSSDTDLVIIQLVDNVNSAARAATFEKDAETLIKNIKSVSPKARVFWVAGWFVGDDLMNKIKQATSSTGSTLVDITTFKDNQSNKGVMGATRTGIDGSTWKITNPGEAMHPGDVGMKLIADKVISKLGF